MKDEVSPELLQKLKQMADEAIAFVPHLTEHERGLPLHDVMEERLSIAYERDGAWRINYRRPNGSVIAVHNRMQADLARAQIRGIASDFAESVSAAGGNRDRKAE